MIKSIQRYIILFIFLILLQVLILNNIQFSGYVNPYLYLLFIIVLPFNIPNWVILFVGFATGFIIDIFANTLGIHTSATVFISFLRPFFLSFFAPHDGYETGTSPTAAHYGFVWFLKYAFLMVFAHHIFLFFIEVFKFSDFFRTFGRIILSTFFTLILVMISQLFMTKK